MKLQTLGNTIAELTRKVDVLSGELEHAQGALAGARKALSDQADSFKRSRDAANDTLRRERDAARAEAEELRKNTGDAIALRRERDLARAEAEDLRRELAERGAVVGEAEKLRARVARLEAALKDAREVTA